MTDRPPPSQALEGAAREFRAIYESGFDYVHRSLRRLGVPARDLEDVAHDVFVVVHRKLGDYDRARPLKPWLFGISFRVASDFLRRAPRRREVLDGESVEMVSDRPSAEDEVAGLEARAIVIRALDSVAEDRRPVFVMAELDGIAVPEIAAAMGIPLNTAYSRLRLARGEFADAVERLQGTRAARPRGDRRAASQGGSA